MIDLDQLRQQIEQELDRSYGVAYPDTIDALLEIFENARPTKGAQ